MIFQNKNKTSKLTALTTVLFLAILSIYFYSHNTKKAIIVPRHSVSKVNTVDYTPASPADNSINETRKNSPEGVNSPVNHPSSPNTANSTIVDATITRVNVNSLNKQVIVGTLINGATDGTCTLIFSRSGAKDIEESSNVILRDNAYSCPNFLLPFSRFTDSGPWQVSLTVAANNTSKTATWPDVVKIQ